MLPHWPSLTSLLKSQSPPQYHLPSPATFFFTALITFEYSIYLFSVTSKLFHLSNCFIFSSSIYFLSSTSSLFNWFSSYFSFDHFYCFFELSFWKTVRSVPWRQTRTKLCSLEQIICAVYICHLPSVFVSSFFLQYPCWGPCCLVYFLVLLK